MAVGHNQWYHFGIWHVQGYGLLTHLGNQVVLQAGYLEVAVSAQLQVSDVNSVFRRRRNPGRASSRGPSCCCLSNQNRFTARTPRLKVWSALATFVFGKRKDHV